MFLLMQQSHHWAKQASHADILLACHAISASQCLLGTKDCVMSQIVSVWEATVKHILVKVGLKNW